MEGKINSEDPVFVSEHHVSITYHNLDFIFIPAIISAFCLTVFCLSTKLKLAAWPLREYMAWTKMI